MNRSFPNPWPEPAATLPPAERQFRLQREELANGFADDVAAIMTDQTLFGPLYEPEPTLSPAEQEFRLEREDRVKRFADEVAAKTIIQILETPIGNHIYVPESSLSESFLSPAAKEFHLEREVVAYNFAKELAAVAIGKTLGGPEPNLAERDDHLHRLDLKLNSIKEAVATGINQVFHRLRYVGTHEDPVIHALATQTDQNHFRD